MARPLLLLRGQLQVDLFRDVAGHVALQQQNVAQVAVIVFRPNMLIAAAIHQLRGDANMIAGKLHCTFDHCVHVQLARDLRQWFVGALVAHDRSVGDDLQVSKFGELRNQVFGHAVGEVVLLGVRAQVVQGKHRQRTNRTGRKEPVAQSPGIEEDQSRRHDNGGGESRPAPVHASTSPSAFSATNRVPFATEAAAMGADWDLNRRNEPVPAPRHRLHKPRAVGGIIQRLAQPVYGRVQAVVKINEGVARPHPFLQLFASDHLPGGLKQCLQNLEGLLLQSDFHAMFPQLSRAQIHFENVEPDCLRYRGRPHRTSFARQPWVLQIGRSVAFFPAPRVRFV